MTRPFGSTLSTGSFLALGMWASAAAASAGTAVLSLGWQQLRPGGCAARAAERLEGAVRHDGWVYMPKGGRRPAIPERGRLVELEQRTAAYNDARRNALARLRDAAEVGALPLSTCGSGVAGSQAKHAIQFTALGTAVGSSLRAGRGRVDSARRAERRRLLEAVHSALAPGPRRRHKCRLRHVGLSDEVRALSPLAVVAAEPGVRGLHAGPVHGSRPRTRKVVPGSPELRAAGVRQSTSLANRRAEDDNMMVTVDVLGNAIAPIEHVAPRAIAYALGLGKT